MSNNITVQGALGRDPELTTAGSTPLLKFSVGDGVGYGDKKSTNWWNCALFGARASTLANMLNKGDKVCVTGEVTLREWEKDGVKRISAELKVQDVWLLGSKQAGQSNASPQYEQRQQPQYGEPRRTNPPNNRIDEDDSDLPF